MKAQVLYGIDNLKYAEVDVPSPKAGEALIELSCCGICGSDVPRIFKTGAHNMPLIPGHEMTGRVKECADRPDLVGKRVGIFPLIPCKECPQCKAGHYEMCENYNYLGSRCDGGFAEYLTAPVWNLLPIPEEVSDEDAAMLEPMSVAVHAIRNVGLIQGGLGDNSASAQIDKDKVNIVVCGLGTIGLLTALFLKDAGYTNVYCIGNKDIQKKKLLEMGYRQEQFFDVRYGDPVAFIRNTTDAGADYYFECIGRSESYEQAVKCTAPLGHVMLVGNPASDMELSRETYWKILRNQLSLTGTWNSAFSGIDGDETDKTSKNASSFPAHSDDWRYVISRLKAFAKEKSAFRPSNLITHTLSIADMPKGLDIMHRKSEDYIKIMIKYGTINTEK